MVDTVTINGPLYETVDADRALRVMRYRTGAHVPEAEYRRLIAENMDVGAAVVHNEVAAAPAPPTLADMSVAQLMVECAQRGVTAVPARATKDQLIALLEEFGSAPVGEPASEPTSGEASPDGSGA